MTTLQALFRSPQDASPNCPSSTHPVTDFFIEAILFLLLEELIPYLVSRYWDQKHERTLRILFGTAFIFLVRKQTSNLLVGFFGFIWGKIQEGGQEIVGGWLGEGAKQG